jgi:cytochrome b561
MRSALVESYSRTAIVLHWSIAALVFAQLALGWWMIDIPKHPVGVRAWWFNVHKSIGITIGLLVIFRILWRLTHPAPPLPDTLPAWQRAAAKVSHAGLYLCLLTMPITGYLGSSFTRYPIKYFGYAIPHWGWDAPALKELTSQIHFGTVCVFMALILVHVTAAVRHLVTRDDRIFQRMWRWPGKTVQEVPATPAQVPAR